MGQRGTDFTWMALSQRTRSLRNEINNGYIARGMGKIDHGRLDDAPTWSVPWQTPKAIEYVLTENAKLDLRQDEG